jgi:hypothetical protein
MNDSTCFERNDTGILSLADLFRHDRLPCRTEPKRWIPERQAPKPAGHESSPATAPAPAPSARP